MKTPINRDTTRTLSEKALSAPEHIGSQRVLTTPFFEITRESFSQGDQQEPFDYYTMHRLDGLIILAVADSGDIILVRQYRHALKDFTIELPCGTVDPGESPIDAAHRELFEETGYRCELREIGVGRIMMNRVAAREYCFFGENAVRDPKFECAENIEVSLVEPSTFRQLAISGAFQQLATLGAVLLAEWKLGITVLK